MSVLSYLLDLFSLSDEQAMLRVQKHNDSQAFALLVRRWETWTMRFCTRLTGDVHRGEDLSQEVFMRIFAHRHDYRHEACFGSYLKRIAFNACRDELRRMRKHSETRLNESSNEAANSALIAATPTPDAIIVEELVELCLYIS